MATTTDIVSLFDKPYSARQPLQEAPVQAALPDTIPFNYDGQLYHIPTAGYATAQEAIDAFLQEQNPPSSIQPTTDAPTDIQIGPQGVISNSAADMRPLSTEQEPSVPDSPWQLKRERAPLDFGPIPTAQQDTVNNDGTLKVADTSLGDLEETTLAEKADEARRRFSRGTLSVGADTLQSLELQAAGRGMRASDTYQALAKEMGTPLTPAEDTEALVPPVWLTSEDERQEWMDVQRARGKRPTVTSIVQGPMWQAGQKVTDFIEENFPTRKEFDDTIVGKLSEPLGQTLGFMIGAAGTPVLAAMLGGSVNQTQQFKDAIINGAALDDAIKAGSHGYATGLSEALPIMSVLERMDKGTGGLFTKYVSGRLREKIGKVGEVGVEAIGGMVEEALQEGFQNLVNNVDAKDIIGYDPDRDRWQGVQEGAEIGGTIGFVLSAFSSAFGLGKKHLVAGAQKRLADEQLQILQEQEAAAQARTAAAQEAVSGQPAAGTLQPDITQAAPPVGQVRVPIENVDTYAANDPNRDFQLARDAIMNELPADHGLTDRQIDRLANLRADARGVAAAGQGELDLGFQPAAERQMELPLTRDFNKPGQFPDSGTQQELPLPEIGGRTGEAQFPTPQGPSAQVAALEQPIPEPVQEAPAPTPPLGKTVVKRAPDFQTEGLYDVTLPDGSTTQIYRDTDQFGYSVWHENRVGKDAHDDTTLGFTKKEAIELLEKRSAESKQPQPIEQQLKKGTTLYRGAYNAPGDTLVRGDIGSHFDPNKSLADKMVGQTGETGEFSVRSRKPLTVKGEPTSGTWHNPVEVIQVLRDADVNVPTELAKQAQSAVNKAMAPGGPGVVVDAPKGSPVREALDAINRFLRLRGYDTIVYPNKYEGNGEPSVIVLDPSIVKHVKSTPKTAEKKTLYRGLKEGGKARGYPGEFVTEDKVLAADYARTSDAEGTVVTRDGTERTPLSIDELQSRTDAERKQMLDEYTRFAEERGESAEDGYLWDVLAKGETDFVYPTQTDVDFLRSKGYDSVRFQKEGGRDVASWFLFGGDVVPLRGKETAAPAETGTGVASVDQLSSRRRQLMPTFKQAMKELGIRPLLGKSAQETLDSLNSATVEKLRKRILDLLSAQALDKAEQRGYDFAAQQRRDVGMEELSQLLHESVSKRQAKGELPPLRGVPTAAEYDTAQLPLRLPEPRTSEPVQGAISQPELPFGQPVPAPAVPATGTIPNPYNQGLPPAPPQGGAPSGTGGGTAAPTGKGDQRSALFAVAESRPVAGEATPVLPERKGVSVAGRSFRKLKPTRTGEWFNKVPSKMRKWVDMALTTSLVPGRHDIKVVKEIMRAQAQNGRALADVTDHIITKVGNLYKASTGKDIAEAPREDQRIFSQYLRGESTADDVLGVKGIKQEFVDALSEARDSIKEMSQVMLDNDMIPAEMRLSLEENLGAYISVSYAANVLNQDRTAAEILEMIPEDARNRWINSFITAYVNPIKGGVQALDEMSMSELRRMVTQFGITERRRVPDQEGIGEEDIQVLRGTNTNYNRATKADLINALAATDVTNYTQQSQAMTDLLLSAFHSTQGATGTGRGRDKSIERRLDLARNRDALAKEGYSEAEIQHMQSTRELLMEVVDPVTNIGITMNKMMNTIVAHRIVNDIASLHQYGLVSLDGRDSERGLTEPLIPRGSALSDIRVPTSDGSGKLMFASVQEDAGRQSDGIYVSPSLARVFQHMMAPNVPSNMAMRVARAATGWTKISLTALAPRSHPRNLDTAVLLLAIRGHMVTEPKVLMESFKNIFGVAMRELGTGSTAEDTKTRSKQSQLDTILEYFTSLGINNDSIRSGPGHELITRMLEDQNLDSLEGSTWVNQDWKTPEAVLGELKTKARTTIGRTIAAVAEKPMTAFRLEDEAVKMLAFMVERRRHASMLGRTDLVDMMDGKVDMTPAQLDELRTFDREIGKYITDLYPTYSRVPAPIRAASRNVFFTPFPSFTAEMWRNSTNDLLDFGNLWVGVGRYKGIPQAKRHALAATRFATTSAYYLTVSGMISSVTQMSLSGISAVGADPTDEDIEMAFQETMKRRTDPASDFDKHAIDMALRTFAPAYLKNSIFDIVDYQPGDTITLRALAFTLPNSQQMEAGLGIMSVLHLLMDGDQERAGQRLLSTAAFLVGDYAKPEVLALTMYEAQQGVRSQGGRIWNDNDDWSVKMQKSLAHISKIAVPGSGIYKEFGKFEEAAKDDAELREMFEFMVGINDTKYRIDNLWVNQFRTLAHDNRSISNSTSKINDLIRDPDVMGKDEFIDNYLKLEQERRESFDDMNILVRSGRALGLTDRTMQQLIDNMPSVADPGGMDVRAIARGRYTPYQPTLENALQSYVPKERWKMSIQEAKLATRADKGMLRERLSWIREYRGKVRSGNYDE